MRTLTTVFTSLKTRIERKRIGALAALVLAGLLCGAVNAHSKTFIPQVYLYVDGGSVSVTSYLQTDQYGDTWVVGFDSEPSFEIFLVPGDGQVLDPYGNQIGYITEG